MRTRPIGNPGTERAVLAPRIGAVVLDHVLTFLLTIAVGSILAVGVRWIPGTGGITDLTVFYVTAIPVTLGYFIVLEGVYGQTIGKRGANIVVTSHDGSEITFRQAIVRNVFRPVDGLLWYGVGLLAMFSNDERKRLGDVVARTVVVEVDR